MPTETSPFNGSAADQVPTPTPAAQELLDTLSRAAAGEGSKDIRHQFTAPVHNEDGVPVLQTASVAKRWEGADVRPYRSIAEASVNNGHPDVTHGSLHLDTVSYGTQTETNIQFDPRTGTFGEYTTAKDNPFVTAEVTKNTMASGMTERRTRAAAKLARVKFGLVEKVDVPETPEASDQSRT